MSQNLNVQAIVNEDRRLVILRLLDEYQGALNSSTLDSGLRAWGHRYIDRNMLVDDLRWLEQRECVTCEDLGAHVLEAELTPKGERVANGKERVTGIARPSRV